MCIPWGCKHTNKVMQKISELIDSQKVDNVILTKYLPAEKPVGTWRNYNEEYKKINENAWMSELIAWCRPYAEKYPVLIKHTYSSYGNQQLKELAGMARRVLISGVVAECCVLFTLLAGIDQGHKMVYLKDACTGLDDEWEKIVEKIAAYYAPMHTTVMICKEFYVEKSSQ